MKAVAMVTAAVLVVIGIGVGVLVATGNQRASPSSAPCLYALATVGRPVPMPKPTRVTAEVQLQGGYELVPAPRSYSPHSSPTVAWRGSLEVSEETTASYQLWLGRFLAPDGLPGSSFLNGIIGWVAMGEHIAGMVAPPGARHGTCDFGSAFVVYNATTGRPMFGG